MVNQMCQLLSQVEIVMAVQVMGSSSPISVTHSTQNPGYPMASCLENMFMAVDSQGGSSCDQGKGYLHLLTASLARHMLQLWVPIEAFSPMCQHYMNSAMGCDLSN